MCLYNKPVIMGITGRSLKTADLLRDPCIPSPDLQFYIGYLCEQHV